MCQAENTLRYQALHPREGDRVGKVRVERNRNGHVPGDQGWASMPQHASDGNVVLPLNMPPSRVTPRCRAALSGDTVPIAAPASAGKQREGAYQDLNANASLAKPKKQQQTGFTQQAQRN